MVQLLDLQTIICVLVKQRCRLYYSKSTKKTKLTEMIKVKAANGRHGC